MADRIDVQVRGAKALVANLFARQHRIKRDVLDITERFGERTFNVAAANTPRRMGLMLSSLKIEMSQRGYAFVVFYDSSRFPNTYYPVFVEYGTRFMEAQFPLTRAYREIEPQYRAEISRVVRGAVR